MEPKALTRDEMCERVLDAMIGAVRYWERLDLTKSDALTQQSITENGGGIKGETKYRMEGALHSILCIFDGVSGWSGCPPLTIVPESTEDPTYRNEDDDWWDEIPINGHCHLHTMLHDRLKHY